MEKRQKREPYRTDGDGNIRWSDIWRSVNKVRFVLEIFWIAGLVTALWAWTFIAPGNTDKLPQAIKDNLTNYRGFTIIGAVVFAVLTVTNLRRLMPRGMGFVFTVRLFRAVGKVFSPIAFVLRKLSVKLGFNKKNLVSGDDEKTYIFDDEKKEKRKRNKLKNNLKWAELTDNKSRIRFIFIDYMILKIKSGYYVRRNATAREMSEEIAHEKLEKELFSLYETARYSDATENIDDDRVEKLLTVNKKKSERNYD